MRKLLVVAIVIGGHVAHAEPCRPDPTPSAVLVKSRGKVEVNQSCEGGYVAFAWTKDANKTAQVARCDAATCKVIASWQGIRNCDDISMCDHYSTVDALSIALVADIDGDAKPDVVLDFATIYGDQGREDHRLSLWLSKLRTLRQVGSLDGGIDAVSVVHGGFAVQTHDAVDVPPTMRCFGRNGPMACPTSQRH